MNAFIMRRHLPTVPALHAFEVVYRRQSISAAASELALTQGAVSKKILALEEYFRQPLFERLPSGLRRTSAAELLWARLPQCLDELEAVMTEVKALDIGAGVLNLAVFPTFATKWLVPRLPLLYKTQSGLSLNLRVQLERVDFLATGLDAGITFGEPTWPDCEHHWFANEELIPVCSPDYLASAGPINATGDLRSHPLLHLLPRTDRWDRWFEYHDHDPTAVKQGMYFELYSIVLEAVKAGLGVGLLPAIFVNDDIRKGSLIPLFGAITLSNNAYYLVYPKRRAALPSLIAFRQWLMEQAFPPTTTAPA
ncbi:MAG: LysR substrate-binding domain-containing protein [Pseudomonadota bacterium]